ncbi:MAG: hypothetical protein GY775_00795 [Candidatus Scalindua sp.]|nr:hypothetical protein [Candidatus Scalindua sp.]
MTMKNDKLWIGGSIVAILAVFVTFISFLWWIGLFNFSGTDASAKVVASALALVGSLVGTLVAIIGVLIKLSMDRRNADLLEQSEKRLLMEAERNSTLRAEGEKRLKLEAAIQAVGLLSTSSGVDVPATQRAGVLFTLANLGLLDLALAMLNEMLFLERIDPNSAIWVINRGLESNDELMQRESAELLNRYYSKFLLDKGASLFPRSLELVWNIELPILAREEASRALLNMISARPYVEWDRGYLNANVVTLISIWQTETNESIKQGVGLCLSKILDIYQAGDQLYPPSGVILIDDVRAGLEVFNGKEYLCSELYRPILQQFQNWNREQE